MGFAESISDVKPRWAKTTVIDRALQEWPDEDAERLLEALHDLDRFTDRAIADASSGMVPSFSYSTVANWRRAHELR